MCSHNDSLCSHKDSMWHYKWLCDIHTMWPSWWLLCPSEWPCVLFTMTLCDLCNNIMFPQNDLCVLKMTVWAHTRTPCGLIVTWITLMTLLFPHNELCYHNSLYYVQSTLCNFNNDFVWHAWLIVMLTRILYTLTMTTLLHNEYMHPYNDPAWSRKWHCILSPRLCYFYNDYLSSPWQGKFTMTMRVFTKNICNLIVTYVPSKMTYEPVGPHNECVPSQWLCDLHHVVVYPHNNDSDNSGFTVTLCDFTMIVWTLIMSSCAFTINMSEFHNDLTITISLYDFDNDSVQYSQWLCVLSQWLLVFSQWQCDFTMAWHLQWLCEFHHDCLI